MKMTDKKDYKFELNETDAVNLLVILNKIYTGDFSQNESRFINKVYTILEKSLDESGKLEKHFPHLKEERAKKK